jgi:hypothetical protein
VSGGTASAQPQTAFDRFRAHRKHQDATVAVNLSAAPMREAIAWLNQYERFWTVSLDRLAALVEEDGKQ